MPMSQGLAWAHRTITLTSGFVDTVTGSGEYAPYFQGVPGQSPTSVSGGVLRSAKGFSTYQVVISHTASGTATLSGYGCLDPATANGFASNWSLLDTNLTSGGTTIANP